jgi:probable addiction module antidote protein
VCAPNCGWNWNRQCEIFEGKGYRVYFARERKTRVILPSGGDKSTQVRDIGGQIVLVGLPEATMKTATFKMSDYLKTQKDIIAYLNAALEDGEPAVLLEALRNVAQASGGMAALAKSAGVSRESLYRTLSRRGNPKIDTIMELLCVLELKLTIGRDKAT